MISTLDVCFRRPLLKLRVSPTLTRAIIARLRVFQVSFQLLYSPCWAFHIHDSDRYIYELSLMILYCYTGKVDVSSFPYAIILDCMGKFVWRDRRSRSIFSSSALRTCFPRMRNTSRAIDRTTAPLKISARCMFSGGWAPRPARSAPCTAKRKRLSAQRNELKT